MNDPIVDEVRKHREEILSNHGSWQNYHEALIEKQKEYGDRLVSLPPKRKDTTSQEAESTSIQ